MPVLSSRKLAHVQVPCCKWPTSERSDAQGMLHWEQRSLIGDALVIKPSDSICALPDYTLPDTKSANSTCTLTARCCREGGCWRAKPHLCRAKCTVPRGARRLHARSCPWRCARRCLACPPSAARAPPPDQARRPHQKPPLPQRAAPRPDLAEEGAAAAPHAMLRGQLLHSVCPAQCRAVELAGPGLGASHHWGCPGGRRTESAAPHALGRCCRRTLPCCCQQVPWLLLAAPLCSWRPPCWQPATKSATCISKLHQSLWPG